MDLASQGPRKVHSPGRTSCDPSALTQRTRLIRAPPSPPGCHNWVGEPIRSHVGCVVQIRPLWSENEPGLNQLAPVQLCTVTSISSLFRCATRRQLALRESTRPDRDRTSATDPGSAVPAFVPGPWRQAAPRKSTTPERDSG